MIFIMSKNESEELMKLLREIRKKKDISQRDLEVKTGLSQQNISMFENSRRKPTIDNFIRYLKGLDIDLKELILKGVK